MTVNMDQNFIIKIKQLGYALTDRFVVGETDESTPPELLLRTSLQ